MAPIRERVAYLKGLIEGSKFPMLLKKENQSRLLRKYWRKYPTSLRILSKPRKTWKIT